MTKQIAILPGDGIGPEITAQAVRVLDKLISDGLDARYEYAPLGGAAYDQYGHPYPEFTQNLCRAADAVLLGAVGGPQYDTLERPLRPERGLLAIRKDLGLFANLRPAVLYKELADASTLKPEVVAGLDILIVRELTGDIYFGEPRKSATKNSAPSIRPTYWKPPNCGKKSSTKFPKIIPTSNSPTCMWTTPPCNSCARPNSLT